MVAVQGIAAPAEIIIIAFRCQQIIDIVVKSLEGEERSLLVAFCRVIQYHIQIDLDPVLVEDLDQVL